MRNATVLKNIIEKPNLINKVKKEFKRNKSLYFLSIPIIMYYLMFHYKPMYGALMAFQDYEPIKGLWESDWVGLKHFISFFTDQYFFRLMKNTLAISGASILFGFPAPLILALLMNEIKNNHYKRTVQTITYLPHFISIVVICGMIKNFTADTGIINYIIALFGGERVSLLNSPENFVPIYVISDIWQNAGWGTIIYLAALTGIAPELYEAATIDGANRWQQTIHVTLSNIMPTIVIMLILRLGSILTVGYEKIILLYNPITMKTADVISTYVYRVGLLDLNWSFSAAVGLFNSIINFLFLVLTNYLSKKMSETSLW